MDPESGLDAVRHVGIVGDRVAAVSVEPLNGRVIVNVGGLVVAPGFIDLHAHGQDLFSSRLQAQDGVTTAMELEGGTLDVDQWYRRREGHAVINFGATVSHAGARQRVVLGTTASGPAAVYRPATDSELAEMERILSDGLNQGALGIGYGIQYTPGATHAEILRFFELSAQHHVTNFVHSRAVGLLEPGSSVEAVQELIADALIADASVHMVHIGSSGLSQVPLLLDMIDHAQRNGVDITTEVYPYTAASTDIRAAIFDPGWQDRLGADYNDIEWVATGERLTMESFNRYRAMGGPIIIHMIPDDAVRYAIGHPIVMIASDGVPYVNGRAHPRGAGTFARVLGQYVREQQVIPLMEGLRKMTIMPARRLEDAVPQMRTRGRLHVGSIADLTVFDPNIVRDRATFADPARPSEGIVHVIVSGHFVVRDAKLIENATPGVAIRRGEPPTP
jgi:N-acyl-D-aspartate/D-glutamate deacylase